MKRRGNAKKWETQYAAILHAIRTGKFEVRDFYVQPTPRDNMNEISQAELESIIRTLAAAELASPHLPSIVASMGAICQYITRRHPLLVQVKFPKIFNAGPQNL